MFNPKEIIKNNIKSLIDELNRFLIFIFILSVIVSIFISNFIIDLIPFLLLVIIIFRLSSKNKQARYKENQTYLNIKKILIKPFDVVIKNIKDKDHVYKRCSKCKTIAKLPLPKKSGIQHAKCPKCNKRLTLYTTKHEIIEVIKKN